MKPLHEIATDIIEEDTDRSFLSQLDMWDSGNVKLYHYTNHKIEGDHIKVQTKPNRHSAREFRMWGRSRAFFYIDPDDIKYDAANATDLYICTYPAKEIYNIWDNPRGYSNIKGMIRLEALYKQSKEDGFSAWYYRLYNGKMPVVAAFKPVEIVKRPGDDK